MTISGLAAIADCGDSATVAPAAARGNALSAVRFHTVTFVPLRMSA